jgi:hypothetical protein
MSSLSKNMKVVSVTPAGRAKYIDILARYLVRNKNEISEHHFWMNTDNEDDLRTISKWCESRPEFFKAIWPDFPPPRTAKTIHHFYKNYCDPETIYLRFDDDICWVSDDCVSELLRYRVKNPKFFLVYANTINHTTCNRFHQKNGCCPLGIDFYFSGEDAEKIHDLFLTSVIQDRLTSYRFKDYEVKDQERVSTNVISWFGRDLNPIKGNVIGNEEQFLAVDYPISLGKTNSICGSAMCCHFAYAPQRSHLEAKSDLLSEYEKISQKIH